MNGDSKISAKSKSHRYPYAPIRSKKAIGIVKRNPCRKIDSTGKVNNKVRNRFVEKEKMSQTFTKNRRLRAKNDFQRRLEFNSQKREMKKRELDKKYHNYDFNPKINQKRINIHPKTLPRNVYKAKKADNTMSKMSKPPARKSDLGKDTHKKKIEKLKEEMSSHLSNMQSNENRSENTQIFAEGLEAKIDSIKYNYSVTNNNSLKSIHQKLKSPKHPDNERDQSSFFENQSPQPNLEDNHQFHGFSKSNSKFTKKIAPPGVKHYERIQSQDRIGQRDFIDQNAIPRNSADLLASEPNTQDTPNLEDPQPSGSHPLTNLKAAKTQTSSQPNLITNQIISPKSPKVDTQDEQFDLEEPKQSQTENDASNIEAGVWEVSHTEVGEKSEVQNDMELRIKGHFSKQS